MNQKHTANAFLPNGFFLSLWASLPDWTAPLCGLTGAVLFLAGTVCFVAYNWNVLGALGKFALPLIGLVGCAAGGYIKGLESGAGKVFSFGCGLFVGLFWTVYGQVFQTGSFVYEFCLGWAVSLVPLALVAGNRWLWLLWAAVVNLYILSFLDLLIYVQHAWILFVFNIACFAVSEWAARRSGKGGWFSLFFLAAALSGCFLAAVGRWGVSFWGNLGLILLVGFYAWRFKRGAAQLGFCALALDILLAERIISSLHYGNGIITVTALLLVFVCSAAGVYGLSRPEEANDR